MRERIDGRGLASTVAVLIAALAALVLLPVSAHAQTGSTGSIGSTGATGSTTTVVVPTTAVPTTGLPTTVVPTTVVPEDEADPVVTTTRRLTTTTLRPTTTTVRSSSTTSSTTSTVVAAAPSTSRPATITSTNLPTDTSSGNVTRSKIDRIVRLLVGIAILVALLGATFAWHTSPRRRVRAADRKTARAAQRLDDAVAASFVGTTVALDSASGLPTRATDGDPAESSDREGLAAKLFSRRDDDVAGDRPNPRPRPNDTPWED